MAIELVEMTIDGGYFAPLRMTRKKGFNMKKKLNKIRKTSLAAALALLGFAAFAQEADDGFVVPLDEDLTKAVAAAPAAAPTGPMANVKQGLWIEVASKNNSLIRNVSDGTEKGYEFDNSHVTGEFNWWFWGEINDNFHLDAEIAALDFDKTLYQANTYGANVPDVTWGDGFQSLATMFFSPIKEGNDESPGLFNKMGFNIATPFVIARLGYGNLKANGMSQFEGIFNVIDRWNYVEDGYLELKNGASLQQFGDFKIDALVALSEMRAVQSQPYGTYDFLDVKYSDKAEAAFTFGSTTTEEQLFYYNKAYTNAWSTYLALTPVSPLKIEGHILKTYGTDIDSDDTWGYAGRLGWKAEKWSARVGQTFAGQNVNSVWGSEGQDYDNINTNTATTQVDLYFAPASLVSFGLDETVTYILKDVENGTAVNEFKGYTSFRTQPYLDFDLNEAIGKDITIGLYGVVDFDKLAGGYEAADASDASITYDGSNKFIPALEEIGLEVRLADLFGFKKTTFDYALKNKWNSNKDDWETKTWQNDSTYELGRMYHSIMLNIEFNDKYAAHIGSVIRNDKDDDDTNVPFAFAIGTSIRNLPLPGHPMLWIHATYSLNPYEDVNYALYRADDPLERAPHRTYLLNTLDYDSTTTSEISVGLIWDLM